MKIFMPSNIYADIIASVLKKHDDLEIITTGSSLISRELESDQNAVGLIPSLDLINHREFIVSSKTGISFDGALSNSFFYLTESSERTLGTVSVRGDVSLNEIILTKILFEERFSSKVEIALDTNKEPDKEENTLVVGSENFRLWDIEKGISFSDQMADVLDLPYVNFIFASMNKNSLAKIENFTKEIDEIIQDDLQNILNSLNYSDNVKNLVRDNFGTVYYQITSNESESLNEMIKLVYYHGIIDDIFEVKFS